ncbi:hypothetical protein AUK04_00870 [Candidatus Roizmanbacteria bacterium CG2_30_33_16]|uniref:Aspartate kinase n=4 Tax=Candidatus Roizmaniibacteriota TaxID=1752723 RepID=A0A2M7E4A7_9BACT|nr:aspartate kinase [Candidatus Roizmanbacteria bacterium]OIP85901.1 MAG: hypothetical protein AUK04_00870 [Candidatus Roizmanbacteria bacterium CG2_30_33_16]PIQ72118.1 MAG: aspartate kinase [Candidatus Roizmanbacteria bacterium CG11_big_fil_rev_8_21_14_0_20_35_14]PIV62543.1 MAG: aspartate kinase [Candidatus Roizmanbacteria bacterium CG01_land_8_20_14_3_00_33_9]PJB88905.1 MAG: aspartate kinase [Candidatus Roizmanbacteria bacterium CG_4_9_14_0_8_um_filter_34_12]
MITIPQVVEEIIQKQPFLIDMINDGLINHSSLARKIRLEIEEKLYKAVQLGAIVMALKRIKISTISKKPTLPFKNPDLMVRSQLMEVTVNSKNLERGDQLAKLHRLANEKGLFFTITQGVVETTIITGQSLKAQLYKIIHKENIIASFENLSAITIKLTRETVTTSGSYFEILKYLAWEKINIIEVVSTYTEFTIIFQDKDVDRAFSVLKKKL